MKKYVVLLLFVTIAPVLFQNCQKKKGDNIVPDNLKVGVSDAISFPDLDKKKALLLDTLSGRVIYQNLRTLVYLSDFASDMIQSAVEFIRSEEITGPVAFSYTSPDDGNVKQLEVKQDFLYQKETWQFGLTVTDEKAGKGLLIVWNLSPLKVIAVLHPEAYNAKTLAQRKSIIMVEYHEDDPKYDRTMTVSISGLDSVNTDYISKLKVFFGQKGDVVDLYGDYNMPYTYLFDPDKKGRSWCFKARNNTNLDIAVARVAMPRITLSDVNTLWSDYALDKVMTEEMSTTFPMMDTTTVEAYVAEAVGNAYFVGRQGFVSNGDAVPTNTGFSSEFVDLSGLNPWPPAVVESMTIDF